MSRVIVQELIRGQTATAARANLTLESWRDAGSDVGSENVREEGLNRRSVAGRAITPASGRQNNYQNDGSFTKSEPVMYPLDDGASGVICGPITYNRADGHKLIVRASLAYACDERLQLAIGYRIGGAGAFTEIEKTHREFEMDNGISPTLIKGSWSVSHLFTLGGASLSTSALYFCVMHSTQLGTCDYSAINLFTTIRTR
jgi:hypothetical protein